MGTGKEANIVFVVGNGFDLSVLSHYGRKFQTSYEAFYRFLQMGRSENLIFKKMREVKEKSLSEGEVKNWADFEGLLARINAPEDEISKAVQELSFEFASFLDVVVTADLLKILSADSEKYRWGYRTFAQFLADLSLEEYRRMNFWRKVDHHFTFNFTILNLNYTELLGNYLFPNPQMNPAPFSTSENNFQFRRNPKDYQVRGPNAQTGCMGVFNYDHIHLHGERTVPRSILFGTDSRLLPLGKRSHLAKECWMRNSSNVKKIISKADLFVLFGVSLGESDGLLWRWIADRLKSGIERKELGQDSLTIFDMEMAECELVLYRFGVSDKEVKGKNTELNNFLSRYSGLEELGEAYDDLRKRVFVVDFDSDSQLSAFGFREETYVPESRTPI